MLSLHPQSVTFGSALLGHGEQDAAYLQRRAVEAIDGVGVRPSLLQEPLHN